MGIAAAMAAIAIHGLVDSFLTFTPTYVLFAIVLGCGARMAEYGNPRAGGRSDEGERGAGAPASEEPGYGAEPH